MILHNLDKFRHHGLLLLRIGIGAMFVMHGFPKMAGGPEMWAKIGAATSFLGINSVPVFWGFMAAFAELVGGMMLIAGFLFRPAAALLLAVMVTATSMHLGSGDGFVVASHAIENGILFFSLLLIGPGKFSMDDVMARASEKGFVDAGEDCRCEIHGVRLDRVCV